MIQNYNTDIILTSGNSLILLCIGMVGYGIWKIAIIFLKSKSNRSCSVELNRIIAEVAVMKQKKTDQCVNCSAPPGPKPNL